MDFINKKFRRYIITRYGIPVFRVSMVLVWLIIYPYRYQLLLEAVDSIVGQSILVRQIMGLPEKEDDFYDELSEYCFYLIKTYLIYA